MKNAPKTKHTGHQRATPDFAVILMLTAIAGAVAQVLGVAVELGRSAGWWP